MLSPQINRNSRGLRTEVGRGSGARTGRGQRRNDGDDTSTSASGRLCDPAQARCLSAARSGRSKAKITAPAVIATAAIIRKKFGFVILSQKLPR
jgi:hypothetical protein